MGISNKMIETIGKAEVCLEIAGYKINTTLVIVNQEIGPKFSYDWILGRNTLKQLPFVLNLQTGELENKSTSMLAVEPNCPPIQNIDVATVIMKNIVLEDAVKRDCFYKTIKKNLSIFSKNDYDIGKCTIRAPTIILSNDTPLQCKPFRTPEKYRNELKNTIKNLLAAGIIEESNSPWTANVVLVQKSNGSLRPLNTVTIPDPYPLPKIEELIHKVSGKNFILAWI